jgi:hypothetical protein
MASVQHPEPMSAETASRLADFARACKAAIRIVSLYPPSHPAIQTSLARVVSASDAIVRHGPLSLVVLPDNLLADGRSMARPDSAVGELAQVLHRHLVGALTLKSQVGPGAWHALLSLLARPAEELRAGGGIAKAWQSAAGAAAVDISEIDYAEVLRERDRGATVEASWEQLIADCLAGGPRAELDEQTLAALLEIARDEARLSSFLAVLQERGSTDGRTLETEKQSLLKILHGLANYAAEHSSGEFDTIMNGMARATTRLTPDMMLSLLTDPPPRREVSAAPVVDLGGELQSRITDEMLGEFVADNVGRERGASVRLAEAFHALAPEEPRRSHALDVASERASLSAFGRDPQFQGIWDSAMSLLMSYSDTKYVPDDYGRELTGARAQATEVEQVSDDPPDRIAAWLSSVTDEDTRTLDQQMLIDLLRIEERQDAWTSMLEIALARLEQLVLVGDLRLANDLLDGVTAVAGDGSLFAPAAREGLARLTDGVLVKHLVTLTRQAPESDVPELTRFCRTVGPALVPPLAGALASEENRAAVRRLKDVLIGFGPAARGPARELRNSPNPAVRRAAVEVLRAIGGDEALTDLRALLEDQDPQVQRDALRGIVQIGSTEAYAMLETALKAGSSQTRETIMHALGSLRDERAAPLLVYILKNTGYRGAQEALYLSAVDALGRTGGDAESVAALEGILYRGQWWAPARTARLRLAAARALHAMSRPEADQVLQQAAERGGRGVRSAVAQALASPRRPRQTGGSA